MSLDEAETVSLKFNIFSHKEMARPWGIQIEMGLCV